MSDLRLDEASVTQAIERSSYRGNIEEGRQLIRAYLDEIEQAIQLSRPAPPHVVARVLYPGSYDGIDTK
jgi:hypothetical protein